VSNGNDFIEQLKQLTTAEKIGGDGFGSMALVIAMKEVTDALERVANRQDKSEEKIDDIHTRVVRMESTASSQLAKENRRRLEVLEKELSNWKTRIVTTGVILTAAWAVFGDTVHNLIGRLL
jgi:hypothetical protein